MQTPALELRNIHKSYGTQEVLKGISLTAAKGSVTSLIGSSGSGKSTLLRCINGLETINEGEIVVGGEVVEMKRHRDGSLVARNPAQLQRIRTRLSMVFQNFNLWPHMTVLENVIEAPVHVLGHPRAQAISEAEALLEKVGMAGRRDYYPLHLSGGQQQRVAIARSLAMQPSMLLFDEPTSALDPELVGEVLSVIRKLADEGRTMIIVTHEMGFARDVSNEVVFLHHGRVEEQGKPEQLFSDAKSPRVRQFLSLKD